MLRSIGRAAPKIMIEIKMQVGRARGWFVDSRQWLRGCDAAM